MKLALPLAEQDAQERTVNAAHRISRIGVISDTHGLLRPEAISALRRCDHIVHGGDIGDPDILKKLSALAPTIAVRGNNDRGPWAEGIAETECRQIGEILIYIVHDIADLEVDPKAAGVHVVVSGHSHAPSITTRDGVLYVNPGSAGPRRFKLPVSIAEIVLRGNAVSGRIIELSVENAA